MIFALLQAAPAMPDLEVTGANAITALIPVVVPFIVFGFRKLIPKIPRIALPFLSMALGSAINAVGAYAAGGDFSPIVGASLGLVGVGLREIADTWKEHGTSA